MAHWKDCLDPAAPTGRYLPWREVARATSISRTTAWRLQRQGEFPKPYPISPGRVGYLETEVEAWKAFRRVRAPEAPVARTTGSAPSPSPPQLNEQPRPDAPPEPVPPAARGVACTRGREAPQRDPSTHGRSRRRSEHAKAITQQMRFDF